MVNGRGSQGCCLGNSTRGTPLSQRAWAASALTATGRNLPQLTSVLLAVQIRLFLATKRAGKHGCKRDAAALQPCLSVSPLHRVKGALRRVAITPQPAPDPRPRATSVMHHYPLEIQKRPKNKIGKSKTNPDSNSARCSTPNFYGNSAPLTIIGNCA